MYTNIFKRLLDIVISFCGIVFLGWLFVLVAIIVKIKLGSPVLYTPLRPGKIQKGTGKEKIYKLYKFRTMTQQCDKNGVLLPDAQRLTRLGAFLRSTSLDELPELFNILLGDMSIVGPRPLAVVYLPYYTKVERHRHDVLPGLTGLAQVSGRNSISWEEKFKHDLEYVHHISFSYDMKIIFLTVKKVIIREGIGQGAQAPVSLHILRTDWLDEDGKVLPEYEDKMVQYYQDQQIV